MNDDNLDDLLNSDEFFKPITRGLGFHQKTKAQDSLSLKEKSLELKKDFDLKISTEAEIKKDSVHMGELAPFYTSEEKKSVSIELNSVNYSEERVQANNFDISLSWLIDTFFITSMLVGTALLASQMTGLSLNIMLRELSGLPSIAGASFLFIVFHSVYFIIFDRENSESPGKKLLGVKLVSIDKKLNYKQVFGRNFLLIPNLLTLGLVSLLKITDKMTSTQIINRKQ